ncbi:NAD(P)H-quinone oxidoreductase [bacterium]|nr:NAD(P)H-quinone oxidoreductase [bacterium]
MKAILIAEAGGPEVLRYADAPDPQPGHDELLVRVHAAALNRADLMQRRGGYDPPPGASPILGLEVAGEVAQGAGDFAVGDRVMAVVTGGGYAELAAVPLGMAMRIPDNLSYEDAAAIPEAFLTAYLNLFDLGNIEMGEVALVHAGASGVGTAAIQLGKAAGATIYVTASASKLDLCRDLGADLAIDYRAEDFVQRVLAATDGAGVEAVLDFIGAPYFNDNLRVLKRGGRLVIIGLMGGSTGDLDIGPVLRKALTITGTTLRPMPLAQKSALNAAFAAYALPLFEQGLLRPIIDSVYPLAEATAAHATWSQRQQRQIILRVG